MSKKVTFTTSDAAALIGAAADERGVSADVLALLTGILLAFPTAQEAERFIVDMHIEACRQNSTIDKQEILAKAKELASLETCKQKVYE